MERDRARVWPCQVQSQASRADSPGGLRGAPKGSTASCREGTERRKLPPRRAVLLRPRTQSKQTGQAWPRPSWASPSSSSSDPPRQTRSRESSPLSTQRQGPSRSQRVRPRGAAHRQRLLFADCPLWPARSFVGGVNRLEGIRVLSRSEVAGLELLSVQRGKEVRACFSTLRQVVCLPPPCARSRSSSSWILLEMFTDTSACSLFLP